MPPTCIASFSSSVYLSLRRSEEPLLLVTSSHGFCVSMPANSGTASPAFMAALCRRMPASSAGGPAGAAPVAPSYAPRTCLLGCKHAACITGGLCTLAAAPMDDRGGTHGPCSTRQQPTCKDERVPQAGVLEAEGVIQPAVQPVVCGSTAGGERGEVGPAVGGAA